MHSVDVHGEEKPGMDGLYMTATKFVGFVDALGLPVCPVELVLKDSQGKWVGEA